MSGLMNAISRGLSQAGYAAGDMYARQSIADQAAAQQTERDKRLAELQESATIRAEDRKNAPMNRLGAKAKSLMDEEVPREDAPVTELSGILPPDGVGPGRQGFTGNLETVRKAIAAMPPGADKDAATAQLQAQIADDNKTAGLLNAGQTRKRTADEALSAAADDAKVNDPIAYAEYESRIGKPRRDERRIDLQETRADNQAKREEARAVAYDKKLDSQEAYQQRREERLDLLADLQESRLTANSDKAETQSQRAATAELVRSTERELERTITLAKDPMLDPAQKTMFEGRVSALSKELDRHRRALERFTGTVAATEADKPPARNGWDSTTGEVYRDGKVVGKAGSEKDARAVYGGQTAKPAAAPKEEPKAPTEPGPKPEKAEGEALQDFKARLLAWDRNRMAWEDARLKAKQEAERKAALAARPDLQRMTQGMR